ncbi:uncharacterized protein LOC129594442 [Paramacrobiotus metropolitanus]|uniref:uncharacterized protein LOC129594442 n=1 Tax=Paramacrobiotus metropolitanus TaxID=2943436 RepID=UPI0024456F41|nr:uncharacterized protein LOC129594442 [Paramacrobiotus metropolitanus]
MRLVFGQRSCRRLHPATDKIMLHKRISNVFDVWLSLWMFFTKISGQCPLLTRRAGSSTFSTIISHFWIVTFTILRCVYLCLITAPLFFRDLTGTLDSFIENMCAKLGDVVGFVSALFIALEWRGISICIQRIRSYEDEYFAHRETSLLVTVTAVLLSALCTLAYQAATWFRLSLQRSATIEADFWALHYGVTVFRTSSFINYACAFLHVIRISSVYCILAICFLMCLTAGRLCRRMKQRLGVVKNTELLDKITQDHVGICRCIKKLSGHLDVFLLLFYLHATMWIVWIINSVAGSSSTVYASAGVQIQGGIAVLLVMLIITFAMIYVHEQADISDEIQERIAQEADDSKVTRLLAGLHRITTKPTGFSIAGIILINRPFIATMMGILFSYGTFVLQLKESRNEGARRDMVQPVSANFTA